MATVVKEAGLFKLLPHTAYFAVILNFFECWLSIKTKTMKTRVKVPVLKFQMTDSYQAFISSESELVKLC